MFDENIVNKAYRLNFFGLVLLAVALPLLPMGFVNSSIVFILIGTVVCFRRISIPDKQRNFIYISIFLFLWLAFSSVWSVAQLDFILEGLRKSRIYLIIPLLILSISILSSEDKTILFNTFYVALIFAVILTFGSYIGMYSFDNGSQALKNKIFFGITSSFLFYWALHKYISTDIFTHKNLHLLIISLTFFSIFFINDGRTGAVLVLILYPFFHWYFLGVRKLKVLHFIIFFAILVALFSFIDSAFIERFKHSFTEVGEFLEKGRVENSSQLRLLFLIQSVAAFLEAPFFGTGLGSYTFSTLGVLPKFSEIVASHPHNQLLFLLVEGGLFTLLLFTYFLYYGSNAPREKNLNFLRFHNLMFLYVFFNTFFNTVFFENGTGYFLALVMAMAFNLDTSAPED